MSFKLNISKLPLTIFLSIILGSLLLGCIEIYITAAAHSRGEYLHLENEYLVVDFPKNWFAYSWKIDNSTSGGLYSLVFSPPELFFLIIFRILDERATQYYMKTFNLTDTSSIVTFETQRVCNWTLTENENATVLLKEKGELVVSGNQALYSKIVIKDGIESDGTFYNLSFTIVSYLENQRLVQIIFWGKKEDCESSLSLFQMILNSTYIKA